MQTVIFSKVDRASLNVQYKSFQKRTITTKTKTLPILRRNKCYQWKAEVEIQVQVQVQVVGSFRATAR